MDKSSNIREKSKKTMVNVNRFFLKLSFAFLMLSCVIVYFVGLDFNNSSLIFAISTTIVFSLTYIICYYLYKFYNKSKTEKVKLDPMAAQIKLLIRLLAFYIGSSLAIYGSYLFSTGSYWSILLIVFGLGISALLYANVRLWSHLSTFCENFAFGVLISYIYICVTMGLDWKIFVAFGIIIIFLILQESFYHFLDIKKHDLESVTTKELFLIRAKYFTRNILLYLVAFVLIAILEYANIFNLIANSNILYWLLQLIPILISIITIVITYFQTFSKPTTKEVPNYNKIVNYKDYYNKYFNSIGTNFDKSLTYVHDNMNKHKGYTRRTGEDYYYHCLNVANILQSFNYNDENLLCTALLHDCIEDLPNCDEQTILKFTNRDIAHSVNLLTKQKDVNYHLKENLENYLNDILQDRNAVLVKIADRMHNISTLTNVSNEKRINKYNETKQYFIPLIEKAIERYPQDTEFLNSAKNFFESLTV